MDVSPIDRASPLPLYVQIKRRLLPLITNWPDPARRFYTDHELCRLFAVSRMTARAALADLIGQGILRRQAGSGSYVNIQKIEEHFGPRMDFLDQWATMGRPLVMDILRFERMPLPARAARLLDRPAGGPCLYIERLRRAGPVPISLDFRYVTPEIGDKLRRSDVQNRSLLDAMRKHGELLQGEFTIEAGLVDEAHTELLELMPGDPVLVRSLVYVDAAARPVLAGHSVYRADQARYSLRVPLSRTEGAAAQPRRAPTDESWGTVVQMRQEFRRNATGR